MRAFVERVDLLDELVTNAHKAFLGKVGSVVEPQERLLVFALDTDLNIGVAVGVADTGDLERFSVVSAASEGSSQKSRLGRVRGDSHSKAPRTRENPEVTLAR